MMTVLVSVVDSTQLCSRYLSRIPGWMQFNQSDLKPDRLNCIRL